MENTNRMSPHGNPVALEKLLVALWSVQDACNEFLEDWEDEDGDSGWGHPEEGIDYAPDACRDVRGLLYNATQAADLIDGVMCSFPERTARFMAQMAAKKAAKALLPAPEPQPEPRSVPAAVNPFYRD